jgi:hypothetical protein
MKLKLRMQNVSFKSVDEFLDFLPEDELKITEHLRSIIFNCIPDVTEKLSYNVPFYKRHKNICFIWPASIVWGNKINRQGVRFGFTHGYLLKDEINFLDKGNRKQVYWKDFSNLKEINSPLLKSYLFDSILIDDTLAVKKNK